MIISKYNMKIANILLSIALALAIALGTVFTQPVFADTELTYELPCGSLDTSTYTKAFVTENGLYDSSAKRYIMGRSQPIPNTGDVYNGIVYIFRLSNNQLYFCTEEQTTLQTYYASSSVASVSGTQQTSDLWEDYSLYCAMVNLAFLASDVIPTYETVEEGVAGIREYIDNSGASGSASFERTITIKPGWVVYVETAGGTLDLSANFTVNSAFTRPYWDDEIRIRFGGLYAPTTGTIFTSSFGSSIDWDKSQYGQSNILGQVKLGVKSYDAGLPDDGSCVVIFNPAYMGGASVGDFDGRYPSVKKQGPIITATFSNLVFVQQYPIKSDGSFDVSAGWSYEGGSPEDYNTGYLYTPSEDDSSTIVTDTDYTVYDKTGNTSKPAISLPNGGYNTEIDDAEQTLEDADNTLSGLLGRIIDFLSAPIKHVQNLFNAGSTFFTFLASLWSWIPEEISTVLIAGVIVLLVIGVIKMLWK